MFSANVPGSGISNIPPGYVRTVNISQTGREP
jgi:hypothetical protein